MPVLPATPISAISRQRERDAWRVAGAIAAGALLLCWPAIVNRYPILFSDTHAYLVQASQPVMVWDKPWIYGPFLLLWHGRTTLWLPVFGQALLVSHLLWLTRKAIAPPTAGFHFALCAALAAGSAAPWFVSLLMPDIFAPVAVLCLFVLGFGASLRPGERRWAGVLGTFAIAAHLSHLVVAAACVVVVTLLRRRWRCVLAAAAPLLGAVVLLLVGNLAGNGRFGISPYGSVFALARLVADGPARSVIERDCPQAGWRMCDWVGRLPRESDVFLWDGDGPVWTTPGGPKALAPEASAIVARTLLEEPGAVVQAALANTWAQLRLVKLGDTLDTNWLEESVVGSLRAYFPPSEEARFRAGMQAHGTLPALAAPLNLPFAALLLAGAASSFFLLAAAWRHRDIPRAGLAALVLAAVLFNAAAGGVLSRPNARYQARIAWLVLLPALMMGKTGAEPRPSDRRPLLHFLRRHAHQCLVVAQQPFGHRSRGEMEIADLAHRRHLGGGAGQEDLVGALHFLGHDRPLHHLDLVAPRDRHDAAAGDAVEEAIRRRRVQFAVEDEEYVGTGFLGYPAAPVEHQRVVEALGLRLVLGQRADHVETGRLRGGRRGLGVRALPLGNAQARALHAVVAEQVGPRPGRNGEMNFGRLCRDGKHFAAAPSDRAHIGIGLAVARQNLPAGGFDRLGAVRNLVAEDAGGGDQPLGVRVQLEDVAAIGPLALEHAAAIVQPMRQDVQLRFPPRHEGTIVPDHAITIIERNQRHGGFPCNIIAY
jgi:hypothetical protein